jgi:recombination protein RecA
MTMIAKVNELMTDDNKKTDKKNGKKDGPDKIFSFLKGFSETDELLDFKLASSTLGKKLPVISSGSLALDDALSSGGLSKGRLIQYYGAAGSGKTLMAMLAMLEAQKADPDAYQVFIDAEGTFSMTWAHSLGLNGEKIIHIDGDMAVNGRKCFEMLLGEPKEDLKTHKLVGKKKEGLFDQIVSGEININMIVLDSLGSIMPPGEDTSAVGKMNMSLLARFLTTTFRKLSLEVSKAKVPFIIINHRKDGMDSYGPDHTFSGGNSYRHFLSANVYFDIVNRADAKIMDDKENKIGHTTRATIEKSKFGPHPRKCEFKVNFALGVVNKEEEIAQLALDYNVVEKPTAVTHQYGDKKWVGFAKFIEAIAADKALADELTDKIHAAREAKNDVERSKQDGESEQG